MAVLAKSQKVDPTKTYNLAEVHALGVFPVSAFQSCRNIVVEDRMGENVLKAKITGTARGRSYQIKGVHLIKFLETKRYGNQKKH